MRDTTDQRHPSDLDLRRRAFDTPATQSRERTASAANDGVFTTEHIPASLTATPLQLDALDGALLQFRRNVLARSGHDLHSVAAEGIRGTAGRLPHLDTIQPAFGRHDVSGVRAYTGAAAEEATTRMGARAYATGDAVALGAQGQDLHTVAHEAAHVVQQRGGVALKSGVGEVGDRYEQHADAVADAVVAGRSAEALLDRFAGTGGSAGDAVQLKASDSDTDSDSDSEDEGVLKRRHPAAQAIEDAADEVDDDDDDADDGGASPVADDKDAAASPAGPPAVVDARKALVDRVLASAAKCRAAVEREHQRRLDRFAILDAPMLQDSMPAKFAHAVATKPFRHIHLLAAVQRHEAVARDPKASMKELQHALDRIKRLRVRITAHATKTHGEGVGSRGEDEAAHEVVAATPDDRVVRLAALLRKRTSSGGTDRFNGVMLWLSRQGTSVNALEADYKRISGGTELRADLEASFGKEPNKMKYLKDLLDNGEVSKPAQLALEVGAIRGGALLDFDRARVRALVQEDAKTFLPLCTEKVPDDYLAMVKERLAGHAMLAELQAFIGLQTDTSKTSDPEAAREAKTKNQGKASAWTPNPDANYLISLVFNGHSRRGTSKDVVTAQVIEWAKTKGKASHPDVTALLAAARSDSTPLSPLARSEDGARSNGKVLWVQSYDFKASHGDKPFEGFWAWSGLSRARRKLIADLVEIELTGPSGAKGGPDRRMLRLDAILRHQQSQLGVTKQKGRAGLKWKVMNALSASNDWDPQAAIKVRYAPEGGDFEAGWTVLSSKLFHAGLTKSQVEQIKLQVLARAAHEGSGEDAAAIDDFRRIPVYQKLRKGGTRGNMRLEGRYDRGEIVELIASVERDSLDWHMIREDRELIGKLKARMFAFGDQHGANTRDAYHRRAVKHWSPIVAMLDLGGEDAHVGVNENTHERGRTKDATNSERDIAGHRGGTAGSSHWAGRVVAEYKGDRNITTCLQIVFEAQQAGIAAGALYRAIGRVNEKTPGWLTRTGRHLSNPMPSKAGGKAHEVLHAYFIDGQAITAERMVEAATARTKLGGREEPAHAAVDALDGEEILEQWCGKSFGALKEAVNARNALVIKKLAKPDDSSLDGPIEAQRAEVKRLRIDVDEALNRKLRRALTSDKAAAVRKKVEAKLGERLLEGPVAGLNMTGAETQELGHQQLGAAAIKEQRYLESGMGWHHRSSASSMASAAMAKYLDIMWELNQLDADFQGKTFDDRTIKERKRLMGELKEALGAVRKEQAHWKGTQDRLTQQTQTIINTVTGLVLTAAGLATGVGAAPGLTQLIIAMSLATAKQGMNQVKRAMTRKGDSDVRDAMREMVTGVLTDTAGFMVASELTLKLDLLMMDQVHRGGPAEQIFGKPMLAIAKNQIAKAVGVTSEGMANRLFADHPISRLTGDVMDELRGRIRDLPEEALRTFIAGVVAHSAMHAYNNLGFDKHQPTTGAAALFPGGKADAASNQFFGANSNDGFNGMSQFVGGPTEHMGASAFLDSRTIGRDIARAVKTTIYEEVVLSTLKQTVAGATQNLTGAAVGRGAAKEARSKAPGLPGTLPRTDHLVAKSLAKTLKYAVGMNIDDSLTTESAISDAVVAALNVRAAEAGDVRAAIKTLFARTAPIVRKKLASAQRDAATNPPAASATSATSSSLLPDHDSDDDSDDGVDAPPRRGSARRPA